jgi:hypothetical protein
MAINITNEVMTLEINGEVIATATHVGGGEWMIDTWPRYFDRNQAISALMLAEQLATGHGGDDARVIAWREELGCG